MGEDNEAESRWVSVAEASREENVPARTLYRWRRSNAIASKVEDGVTLVRLADVRARAGRGRVDTPAPASGSATPIATVGTPVGATAGNGAMAGKVTASPSAELVARLFRLFDGGMALEAIVQREQLLPQTVLDVHRQFESLLAAGGRPSLRDRMAAHEEETARSLGERDGFFRGVESELQFHEQRLSDAEQKIGAQNAKLQAALEQLWDGLQRLEQMIMILAKY